MHALIWTALKLARQPPAWRRASTRIDVAAAAADTPAADEGPHAAGRAGRPGGATTSKAKAKDQSAKQSAHVVSSASHMVAVLARS